MDTTLLVKKVQNGFIVNQAGKTFVHETGSTVIQRAIDVIIGDLTSLKSGDQYVIHITAEPTANATKR
jgi:hypothetical protein